MRTYFDTGKPVESFLAAIRGLLLAPGDFFQHLPPDNTYSPSIYFLTITIAIPLLVWSLMTLGLALLLAPVLWLIILASTWLWAWYLGWAVRVFAKKELNTSNAFQICAYANAPMLLAWIPFLNVITGIWSLVLEWFGLTRYAGVGSGTALLILIVPVIILMLSFTLLIVLVGVLASQQPSIQQMQLF